MNGGKLANLAFSELFKVAASTVNHHRIFIYKITTGCPFVKRYVMNRRIFLED